MKRSNQDQILELLPSPDLEVIEEYTDNISKIEGCKTNLLKQATTFWEGDNKENDNANRMKDAIEKEKGFMLEVKSIDESVELIEQLNIASQV